MLTIGKLTPGRASYYAEQLPGGADEYYTNSRDDQPGHWIGGATDRLGLSGPVDAEEFRRILDARHPADGEPIGIPRTSSQRLAGFDLCFSAPKSVSVAWALGTPDVADAIARAHDRAVAATVEALEAEAVRARRGAGGLTSVETEGVVAAAFGHRTSRAGDPQLHTHVVVANLTPDTTGRWSAIDGARVYRWAKTLGYLYQAHLRAEITATLNMAWGPLRNGAADIDGIDPKCLEAFSKRTAEINRATGGATDLPRAIAKTATLATRAPKASIPDIETLRGLWQTEASQHGIDHRAIQDLIGSGTALQVRPEALMTELLGENGLTANASTFDRRDVLRALAAGHPQGRSIPALRSSADELLTDDRVIQLDERRHTGTAFSTQELLDVEARLVAKATNLNDSGRAVVPSSRASRVATDFPALTPEQAQMVTSLITSGAGVEVVVGRAGTGKTFALDAARQAWADSGYTVIGAALAARAAAELQAGAGIPSTTLDRLLTDLDRPGPLSGLTPNTVVVVDEAGMVGTRKLARLLEHADRRQAKVVLVGDHKQLPEIEAGGAFAALAKTVPASELTDNRRQDNAWEREALAHIRSGSVPSGFDSYIRAGRVTLAAGAEQAREAMVDDWWSARQSGNTAAMYALRRADVVDLNKRARQRLDNAGLLGGDRITISGVELATGDQVVCLRNDRQLGLRNGTVAAVAAVHVSQGDLTLDNGIRVPRHYLEDGHVTHGYATTIHKAQGATVDRAFLLGSEGLYREAGYVGLSRARQSTQVYIVAPTVAQESGVDPVVETIRHLSQSRAQTLAIEQLDPLQNLTGTVNTRHERSSLLADPPQWALDALGPPPLSGPDRDQWARTAERIAAYRDIYAITEPDALGPAPVDPDQRRAWDLARLAIHEYQRSLELDQGLQL